MARGIIWWWVTETSVPSPCFKSWQWLKISTVWQLPNRWPVKSHLGLLFLLPLLEQGQEGHRGTNENTRNGLAHSSAPVCPLIGNNAYFYLQYMCNAHVYDTRVCGRVGFRVPPCMCTTCLRHVCEACILTGLRWAVFVCGVCQASWPLTFWVFPCLHLPSPCWNAGIWDSFAITFQFYLDPGGLNSGLHVHVLTQWVISPVQS